MGYIVEGFKAALNLIITLDKEIFSIVFLSLFVSVSATFLASLIAVPLSLYIGPKEFKGKRLFSRLTYTSMSVPTVVIGLTVAIILARKGPFGHYDLLYTRKAMIIAQFVLVFPYIFGLNYGLSRSRGQAIERIGQTLGANKLEIILLMVRELKVEIFVNIGTAFSRAISEVGAVMIVGGNIRHKTRVITTTISMMNSIGDYPMAIALGLILICISFVVHSIIYSYSGED